MNGHKHKKCFQDAHAFSSMWVAKKIIDSLQLIFSCSTQKRKYETILKTKFCVLKAFQS